MASTGVVAGVFGSLVGMGGAFVLIPALTGLLKFSQHQAHGREVERMMRRDEEVGLLCRGTMVV